MDVSRGRTALVPAHRRSGSIPKGGAGAGAQCVTLMGTLMAFAEKRGLREGNPAHGVKRPAVRKMERFLSETEIARLATALEIETQKSGSPFPAAAIKLLLFTGCRRGEIMGLRWSDVDPESNCLRLKDSKTGAKVVYLNAPAFAILEALPRIDGNPFVVAGQRQVPRRPRSIKRGLGFGRRPGLQMFACMICGIHSHRSGQWVALAFRSLVLFWPQTHDDHAALCSSFG